MNDAQSRMMTAKADPAICIGRSLRHNFFPARIFMGDSGAMCLGFILAAVSIQGLLKTASTVVLLLPLLVLAVPIIERRSSSRSGSSTASRSTAPTRATCTTASSTSGSRSGVPRSRCGSGASSLAGAALATRFVPFREGGEWHLWQTVAVLAIGVLRARVLGLRRLPARDRGSREPRIRRREREEAEAAERLSAQRARLRLHVTNSAVFG